MSRSRTWIHPTSDTITQLPRREPKHRQAKNLTSLSLPKDNSPDNPFRSERYRRLFAIGAAISWTRWAEIFAFSLLTFDLTGSPFLVVVVGLVRMVPLMGGTLVGLLASRFQPRLLIALSVGLAMAVHVLLIPMAIVEELSFWHLVVAAFVAGVALAVDFTVRRPLLGSVVSPRLVGRAISIDFVSNTLTRMLSPALTGISLDIWGFPAVFIWGAAVYGAALIGALGVSVVRKELRPSGTGLKPIREGYRFARNHPDIMEVVVTTAVTNLFVFPYRHFVPVIGSAVLGLTASQVGLLTAAEGLGMTIGSLVLAFWVHSRSYVPILIGGTASAAAGAIVLGLSTWVPLSAIAVIVVGIGVAGFATMQSAIVVAEAPTELRSPVMGLIGTLIGTNPLGLLLLGGFAAFLGPAGAVIASGSIGFGTTALSSLATRRRSVSKQS